MTNYIFGTIAIAVVVFLTSYFSIRYFLTHDQNKHLLELKFESKKLIIPLRIQAYERLALLLERIDTTALILKFSSPELKAQELQALLITTVRSEFEHNLSQQIFVSESLWNQIVAVRESTINLVNIAAGKLPADATSLDLATTILEQTADYASNAKALEYLKKEVQLLF
jgi:hypothetical protein